MPVLRGLVQGIQDPLPDRLVAKAARVREGYRPAQTIVELIEARPERAQSSSEAGRLDQLGGWDVRLRHQQMRKQRIAGRKARGSLRQWKREPERVVERIARASREAAVPHQARVKGGVQHRWRASLVARTFAPDPDHRIVLDADRDRLRVAEPERRRVAAGAGVVIVQIQNLVEEQQPTKVGTAGVYRPLQPSLQRRLDPAGEPRLAKHRAEVQVDIAGRRRRTVQPECCRNRDSDSG